MAGWNDSRPAPGGRISAPVKLYDPVKGYGFLAPGGGLPDIFCHVSVLKMVGLEILMEGATVTCETVRGERGPQVARIVAVDFSTATAARGEVRMHREAVPEAEPASGPTVRALVNWYVPTKGYGFLTPLDGSADLFCHAAVVKASGYPALPRGAAVTCEVMRGERGPQVSRIVSVEAVDENDDDAVNGRPRPVLDGSAPHGPEAAGPSVEVLGTVKFYDPVRGFGFVVPDEGGSEVFVHMSVLARSGLEDLQPGQRVSVWAEEAPRGLQATELSLI